MADIKFVKSDPNLKVPVIKERKWKTSVVLLFVLSLIFFLYFIGILIYSGFSYFQLVWLAASFLTFLMLVYQSKNHKKEKQAKWLTILVVVCVSVFLSSFLFIEGLILSGFANKNFQNLDYIIVLGSKIKESGPSLILKQRLDYAIEYLALNTETIVIVSGGQGHDEPVSEAVGMRDYLISVGKIDADRIVLENESFSTYENLFHSAKIVGEGSTVGIITSNFHAFRAFKIAEQLEYKNVVSMPAPSDCFLLPTNLLREFLAVFKDLLVGNLSLFP
jgi:vancomycin permeability regulator SanA